MNCCTHHKTGGSNKDTCGWDNAPSQRPASSIGGRKTTKTKHEDRLDDFCTPDSPVAGCGDIERPDPLEELRSIVNANPPVQRRYVSDEERSAMEREASDGSGVVLSSDDAYLYSATIAALLEAIDRLVGENGWIEDHEDGSIDEHEDAYCGYCHAANLAARVRGK